MSKEEKKEGKEEKREKGKGRGGREGEKDRPCSRKIAISDLTVEKEIRSLVIKG